jgi:hypothetical protein
LPGTIESGLSEKVSLFHFDVTFSFKYSICVFPCKIFVAILTYYIISLQVVAYKEPGFHIRTNTKEGGKQDESVKYHSKIYRLVQRDEKSISVLKKAIDGEGIRIENIDMVRIENIDMARIVFALIKGDTNAGDDRGAPYKLAKVNGKRPREGEDAEDMRETCCWDCKCGKHKKRRYSRSQCREVRWILLSYCHALLCVMMICCVSCYNTL